MTPDDALAYIRRLAPVAGPDATRAADALENEINRAHGLAGEWIDARQHRVVRTQLDHMTNRAERAEKALEVEKAVNATLVRQIQAVRDMPITKGFSKEFGGWLPRDEVLAALSPQNDGKIPASTKFPPDPIKLGEYPPPLVKGSDMGPLGSLEATATSGLDTRTDGHPGR